MRALLRSPFTAAVLGGAVVAAVFLALGVTGHRSTHTLLEQTATGTGALTPHAIYERDAPAVVHVTARAARADRWRDLFGQEEPARTSGAAFLISASGYLLTDDHVVQAANPHTGVIVRFENDLARPATVVDVDRSDDLALLKVDMQGLPAVRPLPLGSSDAVEVGDQTLALGDPSGADRTLGSGIVSALQRQLQAVNGFAIDDVIELSQPPGPGASGGPLLDADGRVIGLDSEMAVSGSGTPVAFAIPIDAVKSFARRAEHART